MCRLLIVRPSKKNKTNFAFKYLVESLAYASYNLENKDGYSFLTENNRTFRTLNFEQYLKRLNLLNPQKIVMHLRKATTGKVTKENIHLWKVDDRFVVAHNGSVAMYYLNKNNKTDSLMFFEKHKKIFEEVFSLKSEKSIEKLINKAQSKSLKGVYYVRDTFNGLELILSTKKFYIGKVSFPELKEAYFVLSSKEDVLEKLKEIGGKSEIIRKKWLFYNFIEKRYSVHPLIKQSSIKIKEIKKGLYIFTQSHPENLIYFKEIKEKTLGYNNTYRYCYYK